MGSYELESQPSVTTRPAPGAAQQGSSVLERDDAHLQRIGKKPVLKVQLRPPLPSQENKEKAEGKKKKNHPD
jgi:hypothetical protein